MVWDEEADLKMNFPARCTFNLVRYTETGEQKVVMQETANKTVQLENIKYASVHHFSWDHKIKVALLGVHDVASEEELKELFDKYSAWETKPVGEIVRKLHQEWSEEKKVEYDPQLPHYESWVIQRVAMIEEVAQAIGIEIPDVSQP